MGVFDKWAEIVNRIIKEESSLIASLVQHKGEIGSAREALIHGVLGRILPDVYEIGTGEIIDLNGNTSKQIDVIIARKDMPALKLPSGSKIYLLESVLATCEVKSKLDSESLKEALENCASVGDLNPNYTTVSIEAFAQKWGMRKKAPGDYVHEDPLVTARFNSKFRPVTYIFGFEGYKEDTNQFAKVISEWGTARDKLSMWRYPSVIATEGCFAWRNEEPYQSTQNALLFIGKEKDPLRLLILHLLYSLSRKIPVVPHFEGIVPNFDAYLSQMRPLPNPEVLLGQAIHNS